MTGYIRQDTTDQISPDSEIAAEPLDNEYDAIQAAFSSATGHRHNGQIGEGAPIEVVGPTLDVTFSSNSMSPKTTSVYDIGTATFKFRNAYFSGVLNSTAIASGNVAITGGTITGITDLAVEDGGTGASTAGEARVNLGLGTISTQNFTAVDIDGGNIDGTPIGQTTRSSGSFTTLAASGTVTASAGLSAGSLTVGGPSTLTGPVAAPGGISGNSSTASKWQNPMTLSLSGGATGSTSFDGTGAPNIAVTVVGSLHDHAIATTGSNGFMSSVDKVKLNSVETGAQVNTVTSVAGKTGAVTLTPADVGAAPAGSTDSALAKRVRVDAAQAFTEAEKLQGRNNIDLGRFLQPAGETQISSGGVPYLFIQPGGGWGVYDASIGNTRPLQITHGGTGGRNAGEVRNNIGLGNFATENRNGSGIHVYTGTGWSNFRDMAAAYLGNNELGSYAWATTSIGQFGPGQNIAGSQLRPSGTQSDGSGGGIVMALGGLGIYSGTWTCLGFAAGIPGVKEGASLWRKIGN